MDVSYAFLQHQQIQVIQHELARPLLIAKAEKGILACAYVNPATCDKTGEACAIVSGVNTFEDMVAAKVVAVSQKAADLGVKVGDIGQTALEKMR